MVRTTWRLLKHKTKNAFEFHKFLSEREDSFHVRRPTKGRSWLSDARRAEVELTESRRRTLLLLLCWRDLCR